MNILHISPLYYPAIGGAQWHLKEVSERLASRGHHVTVFTANVRKETDLGLGIDGGLAQYEVINNVHVRRFSPNSSFIYSVLDKWRRLKGGYRSLSLLLTREGLDIILEHPRIWTIIPQILRCNADIVVSMNWYWPPAYHTYLARKVKRFTLVGIPHFHTAETWCQRAVYKRMLAKCDAVVVNTSHEADFVRARAATRVEVAGVGVNPMSFDVYNGGEIRTRYGLGRRPVVGFVGRQAANKGAAKLLEAMKGVWKWNPEVRLVLAGPRSHPHNEVETVIKGLTQIERERVVRIDDFLEMDKASIFDAFDVFVLPSIGESFGIAYLEAWLCKKPVIGARIGSTQCVINEGIDGLLVDPNDPEDISRKIIELLIDSDKRERMGRMGHAKSMAQFTWDKVTDKVEELYRELIASKTAKDSSFAPMERVSRWLS